MKYEHLRGLIAAPFTAFRKDGSINLEAVPAQVESLLRQGVGGAYIMGTTGEGISCSVSERKELMEAWKDASAGRLKLIAHIGALSMTDVVELGSFAQKIGLFGTSVVPPCFYRPLTAGQLAEFCSIAASSAPDLPFYYYNSSATAPNPSPVEFLELAHDAIPNLAGIKFNSHNLYEYQLCRRMFGGKYDIVYGVDEFFAGALALGAKSFIGSTYNYSATLYHSVWDAFDRGDWDTVEHFMDKVCRSVALLVKYGGLAAGKVMMQVQGVDCGDPRPPLRALKPEDKDAVLEGITSILAED